MAFRKFMVDKGLAGSTDATGASHQGARKPVELQVHQPWPLVHPHMPLKSQVG
jgi:hypothetical protein